jgi:hypothetical protein
MKRDEMIQNDVKTVATTGGIAWVCPTMGEAFSNQLLVHHQV